MQLDVNASINSPFTGDFSPHLLVAYCFDTISISVPAGCTMPLPQVLPPGMTGMLYSKACCSGHAVEQGLQVLSRYFSHYALLLQHKSAMSAASCGTRSCT